MNNLTKDSNTFLDEFIHQIQNKGSNSNNQPNYLAAPANIFNSLKMRRPTLEPYVKAPHHRSIFKKNAEELLLQECHDIVNNKPERFKFTGRL